MIAPASEAPSGSRVITLGTPSWMPNRTYDEPPTWNSGIETMFLSPSSNPQPSWAFRVCATMLAWESVTPFGRPVVPLEYITRQTSSGRHLGAAARRLGGRQHRFVVVAVGAVGGQLDDVLDRGQLVPDLLDQRHQLGPDEQQLRAGVVDGVVDLVAGQPEVDDRVGGTDAGRRHGQLDAGGVVLVEEGHHVAPPDPLGLEGAGQSAYAVLPLRPGPRAAEVGERLAFGVRRGPVGQPVVEVRRVGQLGRGRGHRGSSGQGRMR